MKACELKSLNYVWTGDGVKNKKRLLIIVMSAALFIAASVLIIYAFNGKYAFMSEPRLNKPKVSLEQKSLSERKPVGEALFRSKLTEEAQVRAYDAVSKQVFDADSEQFWVENAEKNDLQMAVNAFLADNPEVFWLDTDTSYRYYESEGNLCVELVFSESGDELTQHRSTLENAVKTVLKGAPDNATDYDVELYLNDYLQDNCAYDKTGGHMHTAYGALVEGKAVCDGYSRAFQLLSRRLGILCTVVEGDSDFNDDSDNGHMWNCICLGGSWYHVDVTWNDASDAPCAAEHYFYLNLTEKDILGDHVINGDFEHRSQNKTNSFNIFVPECTDDTLNYFRLNFVTVGDPEDDGQIVAALTEAVRKKESFCAFVVDKSYEFKPLCDRIISEYAARWIQGANHFTGGNPYIKDTGKLLIYEKKHLLAIRLKYE